MLKVGLMYTIGLMVLLAMLAMPMCALPLATQAELEHEARLAELERELLIELSRLETAQLRLEQARQEAQRAQVAQPPRPQVSRARQPRAEVTFSRPPAQEFVAPPPELVARQPQRANFVLPTETLAPQIIYQDPDIALEEEEASWQDDAATKLEQQAYIAGLNTTQEYGQAPQSAPLPVPVTPKRGRR